MRYLLFFRYKAIVTNMIAVWILSALPVDAADKIRRF